eukprot:scaffold10462_cov119-Isochrysis_galbana.AAC.2
MQAVPSADGPPHTPGASLQLGQPRLQLSQAERRKGPGPGVLGREEREGAERIGAVVQVIFGWGPEEGRVRKRRGRRMLLPQWDNRPRRAVGRHLRPELVKQCAAARLGHALVLIHLDEPAEHLPALRLDAVPFQPHLPPITQQGNDQAAVFRPPDVDADARQVVSGRRPGQRLQGSVQRRVRSFGEPKAEPDGKDVRSGRVVRKPEQQHVAREHVPVHIVDEEADWQPPPGIACQRVERRPQVSAREQKHVRRATHAR